jgi:hypothetical protein
MQITYIIKDNFLATFLKAFNASMIAKNVQVGFKATRLVLYNLESVINRLNLKPITPLPLSSCLNTLNS